MVKVHSDKFCWRRTEEASNLIAQLQMGDFDAVKMVLNFFWIYINFNKEYHLLRNKVIFISSSLLLNIFS